ncbi:uncharacterized protein LOC129790651 [Lutzomyia longipalpis]|uniref:uncharacterized protein LOC129790651 n=1 Tax=Lutzomyia longipalpis TaxID=7200 RepID=UPI0024843595|nr:uncharacterized protein LOC129790651 [Lutzomyia longipalpis]
MQLHFRFSTVCYQNPSVFLTMNQLNNMSLAEIMNFISLTKSVSDLIAIIEDKDGQVFLQKVIKRIESDVNNGTWLTYTERKRLLKCVVAHGDCSGISDSLCRILSGKRKNQSTTRQDVGLSRPPHQGTSGVGKEDDVIDLCSSESDDDYGMEDSIEQQGGGIDTAEIEPVQHHKNITVLEKVKSHNSHFNYTQLEIEFQLEKPENNSEGENWMEDAFDEVLKILRTESKDGDKIVMKLFLRDNPNHRPIFIGIRPLTALNVPIIFAHLEKVQQSTTVFNSTDVLGVRAYLLHAMSGGALHRRNPSRMNAEELRRFKNKSSIDVNAEKNCLPIALLLGMLLWNDDKDEMAKLIKSYKRYPSKLNRKADELVKKIALCKYREDGKYGIDLIYAFDKKYSNEFRVTVYSNLSDFRSHEYKSRRTETNLKKPINIFYDKTNEHYFCISNLPGFFNFRNHCLTCDSLYHHTHTCSEKCKYCQQNPPCPNVKTMIECSSCNRRFKGQICFNNHNISRVCEKLKMCRNCYLTFDASKEHDCDKRKCDICGQNCTIPHYCHMQPYKNRKNRNEYCIIFYDCESEFTTLPGGYSKHTPNLVISCTVCHLCAATPNSYCTRCGPSERIFQSDENKSSVEKFLDYVLQYREMCTRVIAHNAKSYDGQFILEELCKREYKISPILSGMKILCASVENITFLDSLSFIPFPLAQFSKSFGLEECTKGYYPYKFNKPENRSYVGPYPDMDMYPIASMTTSQYNDFLEWYNANKHNTFDNKAELIRYCRQDVKILMKGCLNFMFSFIETTDVNPFLEAITIADSVMKVYRKNYLKPNSLGITPKNNYNSNFIHLQSKISLKWLVYLKLKENINLRYEVKLRNCRYIADGYDEASNTVYSFEGCYYHGHTCYLNRMQVCSNDPYDTLHNRYEATLRRLEHIRKLGYNVVSMWECEFRKILKDDPQLTQQIEQHREITDSSFNLRSAVYGGRTEVFRLHYKCKPGDRIYYYDFTSLYPWANKYSKYFVGHPTIHKDIESQEEALKYDGVIKCKVLPPRGLYIPCLPYRCNNRLTFPLCCQCAEDLNISNCTHSDNERALTGFWSLDEVRLAVEHGYKIQKCFELWAYETSQYNRETGERGLFADYVDNFLKIKQESSGWPKDAKSDADKERYIQEYLEKEGIQLEKDKIAVNKGMRSLSKIVLNSLWGRFIMREDYSKTTICNSSSELNDLLQSENIELLDLYPAGPTQIFVSWKHIDEHEVPSKYVNLGVGICTTTNARIKLYSVLSKLGRNVFYCDTDSVIYLVPNGQENPLETGKFLGELTDELADFSEGSYIDEFVSCGPKAYGLKIYSPGSDTYAYKVVFKGISMNREVEQKVNFETIKSLVLTENDGIRVEYPDRIIRPQLFHIQSGPCTKTANFTFIKRKCVENFDSLPFGY